MSFTLQAPRETNEKRSTSLALAPDGRRIKIHPVEVDGKYSRIQRLLHPVLIAAVLALPWIKVGGHPLFLLNIEQRRFFFNGITLNASDFYLAFFLLSGLGFSLVVLSALLGRVWCGYACPQTVLMEGLYRPLERFFEGKAAMRVQRDRAPWTAGKVFLLLFKHSVFLGTTVLLTLGFLAYFASVEGVAQMLRNPPRENPLAFGWTVGTALVLYFDFAWFREQFCVVLCPYGRLQSILADGDTIIVGYDATRGEPRGKPGTPDVGDCIDCKRCVRVCPTGIDIRNGLQLECLGCAHCIDACNAVMTNLKRPTGLIRYDSMQGLAHQPRRFWRPRVFFYAALLLTGVVAMSVALTDRKPFEATLLRAQALPHEHVGGSVLHRYVLHLGNKSSTPRTFVIQVEAPAGVEVILPMREVTLQPFESRHVPIILQSTPQARPGMERVRVRTTDKETGEVVPSSLPLLLGTGEGTRG